MELRDSAYVGRVEAALASHNVPPSRLQLEITESVLADDSSFIMERLDALKAIGIRLAIDDFGTGYSSLAYLARMPVDTIKIDPWGGKTRSGRCYKARDGLSVNLVERLLCFMSHFFSAASDGRLGHNRP